MNEKRKYKGTEVISVKGQTMFSFSRLMCREKYNMRDDPIVSIADNKHNRNVYAIEKNGFEPCLCQKLLFSIFNTKEMHASKRWRTCVYSTLNHVTSVRK